MKKVIVFLLLFLCKLTVAQRPELQSSVKGPGGRIEIIKSIPGSSNFAVADRDGNLAIYGFNDLAKLKQFKAHNRPINVLSFNSSGSKMITASVNAKIKIWDTNSWKLVSSFDQPVSGRITFAVFSPDEKHIYFDFNESLYKVTPDFKKIQRVYSDETNSFLTCGIISPDKKHLVFGSGQSIKVFDLTTDKVVKEIGTCSSYINEIEFVGASGVYSWCQDGTLNYWDIKKQGFLNIKPLHTSIAGKDGTWTRLYLSNDQRWLISGNGVNRINVYDPSNGNLISNVKGHSDTVRAFSFSGEKDVFISGGFDGIINKWKIEKIEPEKQKIKADTVKKDKEQLSAPKVINERKVEAQKHIDVSTLVLNIEVWDDNIDGDVISLNWNGKWILKNYEIKKQRKELQLILENNKENSLILYAENLGSAPPNTARVTIKDGAKEHVISINSDLKSCGAVTFRYKGR